MRVQSLLLFLAGIILPVSLAAQTPVQVSGSVRTHEGKPADEAMVFLLKARDSSVVQTVLCDAAGAFAFNLGSADTLLLAASGFGLETYVSPPFVPEPGMQPIPPITLQAAMETTLDEVRIVSAAPVIERKIDRTVVHVEALLGASGGSSAMDALERSPGITLDQNGMLRLRGLSGVLVLIDDKPTYMAGTELENYLRSLPASSLSTIEIMTNPPAKYEAAGSPGVVNIRTKRNQIKGINGNISLSGWLGRYTKTNNSLNLNCRVNRFNLYSSFSSAIRPNFQELYIHRSYRDSLGAPAGVFHQDSYIYRKPQGHSARVGIDYYLSQRSTIGISARGHWAPSRNHTTNFAQVLLPDGNVSTTVLADNDERSDFRNLALNLNFRHDFDSAGQNLILDADHVRYASRDIHHFENELRQPSGTLIYADQLDGALPSDIYIWAGKADYTKPHAHGGQFEAGLKASHTSTDNAAVYIRTIDGESAIDYSITNQYLYREWIAAAYLNYNRQFGRLGLQSGLRGEATRSHGEQLATPLNPATTFTRNYNNLFPTLFISYQLDSAALHTLNANYGRRINRPMFQDLNPFLSPLDRFTFYSGNPFLSPSFTQNFNLSYSYKGMATLSLSHSRSNNEIMETLEIVDGIYYSRPGNIGKANSLSLSAEGNFPLTKFCNLRFYHEGGRVQFNSPLYDQVLDTSALYAYLSGGLEFKWGKGWTFDINGEYNTRFASAQVATVDFGMVNAGLKKTVLKDKGTLRLALNDALYTRAHSGDINNLFRTRAYYVSRMDSRVVGLVFSYRFGGNLGEQRKHSGSGSEAEQQRVGH